MNKLILMFIQYSRANGKQVARITTSNLNHLLASLIQIDFFDLKLICDSIISTINP